mgnify:CR=1 FL=1
MVKHIFRYASAPASTTHLEEWKKHSEFTICQPRRGKNQPATL